MSWDLTELNKLKKVGKKVVFTNGCFDLVHRGHLTYLQEAKALGDLLVVGLDSDLSVKKLKGHQRPINNEIDRKFLLENLKPVDFVFIFEDGNPLPLIQEVNPDVLVKGGDWRVDQIIGGDFVLKNGGKVLSLPFVEGHSTTMIINKIKSDVS